MPKNTVIVTGASQGIGAAIVQLFLECGYDVVATSRNASRAGFAPSPYLALIDGDIGQAATAEKVAQAAIDKFGSINHVVNNAGIFAAKPFTAYTADDFSPFRFHQSGRIHFHNPARSQADAVAEHRRERDKHHNVDGRASHRRRSRVDSDDHQRRT
jgi:short-subunit dehydrogenase involved in D-alanine esterification of teichoic acids